MLGTKMEIHMVKAEPGSWGDLSISEVQDPPANGAANPGSNAPIQPDSTPTPAADESTVDALDLDDLELVPMKVTLSAEASGGRTDAQII